MDFLIIKSSQKVRTIPVVFRADFCLWYELLVKTISNLSSSSLPADLEIHQAQADPVDLFHPVGRNSNVKSAILRQMKNVLT